MKKLKNKKIYILTLIIFLLISYLLLYFMEIENFEIYNNVTIVTTLTKESNTFLLPNMFSFEMTNRMTSYTVKSVTSPFNPYYFELKGKSLDNVSINTEGVKLYDAIKKNDNILNYIEWDKPGFQILNSEYGKLLYLRFKVEPCQSVETYYADIKKNVLFLKIKILESKDKCSVENYAPFVLGEEFVLLKNSSFNEVKITIKNSKSEITELNELVITENKNDREKHYDGNVLKW